MKQLFLFIFLLLTMGTGFSQVAVTATAGITGPSAYANLKAAFDAINAGTHRGDIAINLSGNTVETATAAINANGSGNAFYTGIIIRPVPGMAIVISGNIAAPLIDLNGADNITIDGLNTAGSALTVTNTNTSAATEISVIRFVNDASNNFIQNTNLYGAASNPASGTVLFGTSAVGGAGNDNNFISNCTIADANGSFPVNAVYSAGTAVTAQENSANTLSNNFIVNYFNADQPTAGVLLAPGNTDWTISGNKFYQTAARIFTTGNAHRAIQVTGGNNYRITNNTIGYATAAATGVYTLGGTVTSRFIAIDIAAGTLVASSIQNNVISGFSFATSNNSSSASGIWCAINITSGNVNVGNETGNTIGSISGNGNITVLPSVAGTLTVGITATSAGIVNILNNTIGSIDVLPAGVLSGNLLGIQTQGATGGNVTITANTIGNESATNLRVGTSGITTGNGIVRGILNTNTGTINITGNTIRNLVHNSNNALALFRGIECQQGTATISANTVTNVSANGTSVSVLTQEGIGILLSSANAGAVITKNTISNLGVTNATTASGSVLSGIYLSSAVNGTTITANLMYGFTNASTSVSTTLPGVICGIYCRDASVANPLTIANNMLSFGNGQNTNTSIIGIWNQVATAASYQLKIYYNTVNIAGTVALGAQPSFGYYRGDFSNTTFASPVLDIRNNLITNTRTGGSGKHYAISNGYPSAASNAGGWPATASDYNVLNAATGTIGYWSGDQTFTGWQMASAGDERSLSGVVVNYVNTASDLHVVPSSSGGIDNKGTPLAAIATDIDDEMRSTTTPDPGADEFSSGPLATRVEYFKGSRSNSTHQLNWKATCTSNSIHFSIERSSDGRIFESLGGFSASKLRCAQPFDFTSAKPLPGINYYRLKMAEADGAITYSGVVSLLNGNDQITIARLLPNVVKDQALLTLTTDRSTLLFVFVTDAAGRIVQKKSFIAVEGKNTISLRFDGYPAGMYQLTTKTRDGNPVTISFIKQ